MIGVIAQPTYLPWMGYFYLINKSDVFVFLDSVQFERRSWQCRNRIKGPDGEILLTVPVIKSDITSTRIYDVKINNSIDWAKKHLSSIVKSYSRAPFFKDYKDFFEVLYTEKQENLSDMNIKVIKYLTTSLGIKTKFIRSSELSIEGKKTNLLISICKKLNITHYISNLGSSDYMEDNLFKENNISLEYLHYNHPIYPQMFNGFIPFMSVIDILFNCGVDAKKIILSGVKNE